MQLLHFPFARQKRLPRNGRKTGTRSKIYINIFCYYIKCLIIHFKAVDLSIGPHVLRERNKKSNYDLAGYLGAVNGFSMLVRYPSSSSSYSSLYCTLEPFEYKVECLITINFIIIITYLIQEFIIRNLGLDWNNNFTYFNHDY
jgi:hypothetical protein